MIKFSLTGSLVLVSCTKLKLENPAPAKDLYSKSPIFKKKRAIIERDAADWIILSALHGVVLPDQILAPYNQTLVGKPKSQKREWANHIFPVLLPKLRPYKRIVALAGNDYLQYLLEPLAARGIEIELPLRGMGIGKQNAWLTLQQ